MDFDTARQFVDYILSNKFEKQKAVIIEFIGGEPFIEVDLIDKISDYFKIAAYKNNSDWYWNYRINICTNGVNYSSKKVQDFLEKNKGKLSISITIDGIKEKHDLQRVFPNGAGSYDTIRQNIPLWVSQFGGFTKVTFASDDLIYLKDSIVSLWDQEINVAANVVFEDVWKENDDLIFEKQLMELADYILDNAKYDKFYCTLFEENIGRYYTDEDLYKTYCGAGKMLAIGPDGKIYPCIRYKDYSLNNHEEWIVGTVSEGIDMEKVRPFVTAMNKFQSDAECISCEVATGCAFCQGFNYDQAETPTNFSRAKYICKMHKARVRANDYYFSKLYNMYGIKRENSGKERKMLYFLLSDDFVSYCQQINDTIFENMMQRQTILDGLAYARRNFFYPIFVHSKEKWLYNHIKEFENFDIFHIVPAKFHCEASQLKHYVLVFSNQDIDLPVNGLDKCILNVCSNDISNLSTYVTRLLGKVRRIELNIQELDDNFDEDLYYKQLVEIKDYLIKNEEETAQKLEISLITDLCNLEQHNKCKAGNKAYTYAPDGNLYVCPAFYSKKMSKIGNVPDGIVEFKNRHLYKPEFNPICNVCDTYQCANCAYLNNCTTNEVNVSPSFQCRKSHVERKVSLLYQKESRYESLHQLEEVKYMDPISELIEKNKIMQGYYHYNK
jgi:radical SAM peptide maturase (CXXX-repeat target family)/CXXX repeat peptide maturase